MYFIGFEALLARCFQLAKLLIIDETRCGKGKKIPLLPKWRFFLSRLTLNT